MANDGELVKVKKVSDVEWEIPIGTVPNMKVSGRVFMTKDMLEKLGKRYKEGNL